MEFAGVQLMFAEDHWLPAMCEELGVVLEVTIDGDTQLEGKAPCVGLATRGMYHSVKHAGKMCAKTRFEKHKPKLQIHTIVMMTAAVGRYWVK
jgi:hypothetical protein